MSLRWSASLACLALVLTAALAGGAALRESVTYDEVSHIGAGLSYLQKLDLRLNPEHPPLAKIIAAAPLAIRGTRADYSDVSWKISERFFPAFVGQLLFGEFVLNHWNDASTVLMWARAPMVLLMLAMGAVIFVMGRRLGGPSGALLCVVVFAGCPTILANGPLVHTDVAVALFTLLTLLAFANVLRHASRRHVGLFALGLAAALLSKFSAIVLLFDIGAILLSLWIRPVRNTEPAWISLKAVLRGLAAAGLLVYVFYLVFSWNQPSDALAHVHAGPSTLFVRRALLPPWLYVRGLFMVVLQSSRPTFVLGRSWPHGIWFYFPVLLALKSPPGFLVLLLMTPVAVLLASKGATPRPTLWQEESILWRVVWVSTVVQAAVCIASRLNIGFRHFIVPLALLIVMIAPLAPALRRLPCSPAGRRAAGFLLGCTAASCLVSAVLVYPYYIPYVNVLALGRPAYRLFDDSNLDWGQSLPEVRRFVEEHHVARIALDPMGFTDTKFSVPQSELWDCHNPELATGYEWAAISANRMAGDGNCRWLLRYPSYSLAGGSMFVIRLPLALPAPGVDGRPTVVPDTSDKRAFLSLIDGPAAGVETSARDTQKIFRSWTSSFLQGYPWLRDRVLVWIE